MANGKKRVDIQVGFSVDKSGLSEMQSLFQQIANKAADPTNKMKTGLQEAAKTASTLNNILTKTFNTDLGSLNVTKFNQELSKSGLNLKDVKANLSQAGNQGVTAFNRLSQAILGTNQQIKQSNKALDQMFTTFKNTIRYGISSSIFNNMANSIQKAFDYSKQLDTSLNDIRIVTDKSAESMAKFAQQANEAAKGMGASTLDYTNAALIYYQQGLSDSEVQARAETTIKAANVTGQTGEEVSEQLTAVWNGYKVSAEETELYVDKLAAVAATTAADLEELSVGMSKVASAANAMGVDFDDLNAQIATIVSVTRQAPESVGTALKTIYARMGDLSVEGGVDEFGVSLGKVSEQMQMMGIEILDQNGNLRDMTTIMAEVAKKWDTWTEAQKQAAAVAMAGKRQYNNLVALFENWDMYTDALNTSTEAVGTLQHQQDIYMETTASKLKTLKAAWQGLYADAINKDEIDDGIEALTNLVEVFDNFISSFGGGLKSVAGFGAILSSVFNKQISESIVAANQRLDTFKNNLILAQQKNEATSLGTGGELTADASAKDLAIEANAKVQLDYAKQIYEARAGLNQEQAKSLINLQKEIGKLEEEAVLLEKNAQNTKLNEEVVKSLGLDHLTLYDTLSMEVDELFEIDGAYDKQISKQVNLVNNLQRQAAVIDEIDSNEIDRQTIVEALERVQKNINSKYQDALGLKIESVKTEENHLKATSEVVKWIDKQVASEKKRLAILRQEQEEIRNGDTLQNNINSKRESQNNKRQEADDMLKAAQSASVLTQNITTVTSALGNMAMAWSSVNSLMDTWRNDSIDFGDKLLQTMMTLGMTVPIVVNNFSKLKDTLNITSSLLDVYNTKKVAKQLLDHKEQVDIATNTALTVLYNNTKKEEILGIAETISKKQLESIVTKESNAGLVAYNLNKKAGNTLTKDEVKVLAQVLKAKAADINATNGQIAAHNALKTSLLTSPFILVIGALTAIAGITALVAQHYKKLREEAEATAKASAQQAESLRNEYQNNEQLVDQYDELYQKYKAGEVQKEELWDVTNKLIDSYDLESARLAALRGDYDSFTRSIEKAREAKRKEILEQNKDALETGAENVAQQARKGDDFLGVNSIRLKGDNLQVSTLDPYSDAGLSRPSDVDKINDIYKDIFKTDNKALSIDTTKPEEMIQTYQKLLEYQKALSEAGYENSDTYIHLGEIIKDFNTNGAIDNLLAVQDASISDILDFSDLDKAISQDDFNAKIESIRKDLGEIIPNPDEVQDKIAAYVATINTEFADQFIIDDVIKERFGDEVNEALLEAFKKYDPAIQSELLDKYHFDLTMGDTEKGIQELQKYVNYITNSPDGVYSIPFEMQMSTNETILKGKDINKSDWDALTESTPNVEETLGTREEFNNKSIGERITLMEQLNQKIQEEAHAHIESYEAWKSGQEEISNDLQERIDKINEEIDLHEKRSKIAYDSNNQKEYDEEIEKVKELKDELEDLSNQKYQVDLELNSDYFGDNIDSLLGGMIGEVVTQTDQLKVAAESVGEAWTIAADDVQNFASIFPELMADVNNFKWLEDGSVQLTEIGRKLLNDTLGYNEQIMASNKQVVLDAIDDRLIQLKADAELQQARIQALEKYLSSELDSEAAQQQLKQELNQATMDYVETLRTNDLTNEATAQTVKNNIADQGNMGLVKGLQSVDENIAAVRESYANIFNENYSSKLPGYKGSGVVVTSSYNKATVEEAKKTLDEQTKAFVEEAQKQLEDAKTQLSQDMLEISSLEGAAAKIRQKSNDAKAASDRVQSGHAGKESKSNGGGGGSKDKQKKEEELKQLEDEFDRYWEIHKALEQIDRDLKKIDKEQEHLNGPELIASLEEENKVLEQQKERYEQLYQAQQAEAAELRGQLSGMGVVFDESSGAILNYAEAVAAALATYNAAVAAFNAGPQDEAAQKSLEAAEKAYENFKKLMERYDTLYYTEMQDTQEKMEDIWRKEMENKLKAWKTKVELELDKNKLEQQWDEFMLKAKKDFKKVWDMQGTKEDSAYQVRTGERAKENVMNTIKRQHEVEADMDRMKAGGQSELGFQSIGEARDALKELDETMRENGDTVYEAYQNAWKNYLDGIDQVADALEMVNSEFERQNEILDYNRQIIELLYGDEAYDLMAKYYQGQYQANINNIASLVKQRDTWREQLENVGLINKKTGKLTIDYKNLTEDQKKLYDHWRDAQSQIYDLTVETVKLLQDEYANEIDKILKKQTDQVKKQREEWEMIKKRSEGYYDSIESTYQIQKLASKYDQSIADAKSLKAQEKLKKLQEEEIDRLRKLKNENKELSEYEIQYANAKYEAALREIALEEAQNNKTSMKLTRDEQGNWSYQYIAEEEDVAAKRQELYDAYNELYQLASDAYEKNLETMISLEEEYYEKLRDIAITYRDDKKTMEEEMAKLYKDYYGEDGLITRTAKKNTEIRQDLETATATLLINLYDQDQTAVESMTTNEKKLVTELAKSNIKDYSDIEKQVNDSNTNISKLSKKVLKDAREDWSSSAQKIINKWNKDNGSSVRAQVEKAYDKIMEANENYKTELDNLEVTADTKFGEDGIKGDIDAASEATTGLLEETERLCDDGSSYIDTLREYVNELEGAWREVCSAIEDAIDLLREYLSLVGEVESAGSYSAGIADYSAPEPATVTSTTSSSSGSNDTKGSGLTGDKENITPTHIIGGTTGKPLGIVTDKSYEQVKKDIEKKYDDHDVWGTKGTGNRDNNIYIDNLDTGGYTGSWNNGSDENNGRLAFLHQRELVLNADDTKNFLAGVNTIRDMVASNGSIEAAVLRAAANMANSLNGMTTPGTIYSGGNTNNSNENVFNITAEFPNANSVDEIREAILSLPNLASQYIHSNLK